MKRSTSLMLLMAIFLHTSMAQIAKPVTISGQVSSDNDSIQLVVWFSKDPLVLGDDTIERIPVALDKEGRFTFTTKPISSFARLSIHDAISGNELFVHEQQPITPGDKIQLYANIHGREAPFYFKAIFLGQGAAKYECVQALKALETTTIDKAVSVQQLIPIYDSLLLLKQQTLESFSAGLTRQERALLDADLIGKLRLCALVKVCGYDLGSVHDWQSLTNQLPAKQLRFDSLVQHFTELPDSSALPNSIAYREFLYHKTKAELVFENKGASVSLTQLYQRLSAIDNSLLREKLLSMLLLSYTENYSFFGGINPDEYRACLVDAIPKIQSPELKKRIGQFVDGLVKGATAYNFRLPLDSSASQTVSLADLKGKVVLLDIWSYNCTGCIRFTQTFHKRIFPLFKDNPSFAVASILLENRTSRAMYLRRLRSEGGVVYTYPDYINLFGGAGIASARAMEQKHKINAYPTLILLDKQGKVYSSTLPVIYGDPHNKEIEKNIDKLAKLIADALAEPVVHN